MLQMKSCCFFIAIKNVNYVLNRRWNDKRISKLSCVLLWLILFRPDVGGGYIFTFNGAQFCGWKNRLIYCAKRWLHKQAASIWKSSLKSFHLSGHGWIFSVVFTSLVHGLLVLSQMKTVNHLVKHNKQKDCLYSFHLIDQILGFILVALSYRQI